jgi:hypothetical protein
MAASQALVKVGGSKTIVTAVGFLKSGRSTTPAELRSGSPSVTLESEPDNAFDPNAVKVLLNGMHAAYVCRADTADARAVLASKTPYEVEVFHTSEASAMLLITPKA